MGYDERQKLPAKTHTLTMEDRARLAVSGVEDVESFDENTIIMSTVQGDLTIRGEGLHIDRISLDTGELTVQGSISELCYEQSAPGGSFWSRLFG